MKALQKNTTLSTIQKIVLYQKAIDDMKRRHIYFPTNQGKLLEKHFIQARNIYKKTLPGSGLSRQWACFLRRLVKLTEDYNQIVYCTISLKFIETNFKTYKKYVNVIQSNGNNTN